MGDRISVVLIERAFLLQSGIRSLLAEFPGLILEVVFDGSEKHLVKKINKIKPDLIIINPEDLPAKVSSFVNKLENGQGLMIIGLLENNTTANIKSQFRYYLNKHDGKFELLEDLKNILGKRVGPQIKNKTENELSEREKTIVKQVVSGLTNQEIADKLFLSIHTVTTHRKNITRKLGIKTASGLTVYALMNKIVDIQEIANMK